MEEASKVGYESPDATAAPLLVFLVRERCFLSNHEPFVMLIATVVTTLTYCAPRKQWRDLLTLTIA